MDSIFRSLEIIEARIAEKLTVSAIADSVHFSKFHYQRLFREIVGESVMAYVMKRKHALAGEMLRETDTAVLDVALAFGFDSHEGFTRSFKARMGATPSDYRKKGGNLMKSKGEIVRELEGFIAAARETAEAARHEASQGAEHADYLRLMAEKTDALAGRVSGVLDGTANFSVTNRLEFAASVGSAAFSTNLMALNVALAMHRAKIAPTSAQKNLCDRYYKLAETAQFKAEKAREFFAELAALIFADMRKTAAEKIAASAQQGKITASAIVGHENVRFEVGNFVARLEELSLRDSTAYHYDDALFQLDIIKFAFETDLAGAEEEGEMLAAMAKFRQTLADAVDFFRTIPTPEPDKAPQNTLENRLLNAAFQGNILLFYTRGEVEKSGKPASNFDSIVAEINTYIQTIYDTDKINTFFKTAHNPAKNSPILSAAENLQKASAALRAHGGSFAVLADEFENLAGRVREISPE
ncbi:MAG: AraC family transcriptional regulator [Defluviitaleaceae bacterium]|nr:AraC family transcriptional regulator [Defluviitaleaceae bacterium]